MKKSGKKIDIKTITSLTTVVVTVFALAILGSTGAFIMKSLGEVSVAKAVDSGKPLKVQGVNGQLLEKVQKFIADKSAADMQLAPQIRNPFEKPAPPPEPPPPPPGPSAGQPTPPPPPPQ